MLVGAPPWVYAATQPGRDITPILDQIFADVAWAGYDGIELMHTALLPDDAAARLADAERIVSRLGRLGGATLGTSVGNARAPKTPEQLDAQAYLLRQLIALCAAHGVVLNLHNHTYEVENGEHDLRGTESLRMSREFVRRTPGH